MFDFVFNKQEKQEQKKSEPLDKTCKICGGQMDVFEDRYSHRKLICNSCKNFVDVEETDAEREERIRTDMRIEHMRYEQAHPIKSFFKDLSPGFIMLGGFFLIVIILKLLGAK